MKIFLGLAAMLHLSLNIRTGSGKFYLAKTRDNVDKVGDFPHDATNQPYPEIDSNDDTVVFFQDLKLGDDQHGDGENKADGADYQSQGWYWLFWLFGR